MLVITTSEATLTYPKELKETFEAMGKLPGFCTLVAQVEKDGQVCINGKDPVVFIHFTKSTIRGIVKGEDALLAPFLDIYRENLQRLFDGLELLRRYESVGFTLDS